MLITHRCVLNVSTVCNLCIQHNKTLLLDTRGKNFPPTVCTVRVGLLKNYITVTRSMQVLFRLTQIGPRSGDHMSCDSNFSAAYSNTIQSVSCVKLLCENVFWIIHMQRQDVTAIISNVISKPVWKHLGALLQKYDRTSNQKVIF